MVQFPNDNNIGDSNTGASSEPRADRGPAGKCALLGLSAHVVKDGPTTLDMEHMGVFAKFEIMRTVKKLVKGSI